MVKYAEHVSTKVTPQSEKIPGSTQVPNSAGGFAYPVDDWVRLDRFLILGNEGGSYYANEKKLTQENATCIQKCLDMNFVTTINRIIEISDGGRAPKNDPAIFALALAASYKGPNPERQQMCRSLAMFNLVKVCRTGTHLFQFAEACQSLRGWGRGLRNGIGLWYKHVGENPRDLAYQCVKYQQRNGWSHRDLLRLSHPKLTGLADTIAHWVVKGEVLSTPTPLESEAIKPIYAFELAKKATDAKEIVKLIRDYRLVRECIPTQFLNEASVWEALLEDMPLTAMVRNLATMTRVGLLAPMSDGVRVVVTRLMDSERLKKSRMHPIAVLAALLTYKAGRGVRGSHTWTPVTQIVDALDACFYKAFGNVEPSGKRIMLALDVSGSMEGGTVAGVPGLTPRVGSAAMALVTANTEPNYCFTAFSAGMPGAYGYKSGQSNWFGSSNGISPLTISPRQRLDDVCSQISNLPFGGTDCALPMLYAGASKLPIDCFVILTDSETWAGGIHPTQALQQYRNASGIPAKLVVVGMVANNFSIADTSDGGMMDVVGFDTSTPQLISNFAKE